MLAATAVACAHLTPAHAALNVSSVGSDYSPQLSAKVTTTISSDSVVVHLSDAKILAPGDAIGIAHPLMRDVTIEALLVGAPPALPSVTDGATPPWEPLAQSETRLLADSLFIGVAHSVTAMRFALARPVGLDPARSWLVFRIRATGVATPVRLENGTLLPGRDVRDGVRVYACSDRSLNGAKDRERAKKMRKSYLAAC
ncbi:MAG: hypothetical protein ABIT38_19560 [Gemmatimonadaceae bacterium]